jgi:deoxyadenosine/deoxycytidine kinase
MNTFQVKIISIEGNIGSGKSTLLENLKNHYKGNDGVVFLKEPVDDWEQITDETGVTMLEKFYSNQEKYSFPFQMMAFISRLSVLKDAIEKNPGAIIITERSLYTDKMVFAKMLFDANKIELVNYKIYQKWFDTFVKDYPVDSIVYVKADPVICLNRIAKRSRTGESEIPLSYLSDCHEYHNRMLDINAPDCVSKKQLVLNGCIDIYEDKDVTYDWINLIDAFIF